MRRKNHIVVVDGKNLLWRNADAFNELSVHLEGEEVNIGGMYGFICGLLRIHSKYKGRVIVAWEGTKNFRFDLYPNYKNKSYMSPEQKELYEEVKNNEGRLNELLSFSGIKQFYGIGCECDDVMGTIVRKASEKNLNSIIYTGDSDLRQLVSDKVLVVSPGRGKEVVYDSKAVKERHGVVPKKLPLLKALAGDHSDNIPGLKGVGEKTAALLVSHYKTLANIINASDPGNKCVEDWPVPDRFRNIVWDGRNDVALFLTLTKIRTDVKMKLVPVCKDKQEVVRLLKEYEFRSLSSAADLLELTTMGK